MCQVDQVIDFWTVDDELVGKFQISSFPPSPEDSSELPNQRAVIFKVKTTSPFNFWVRPAVGLMRPNVVCTVEVICDSKASRATMSRDEFLVEVAPVPGASVEMTSDLYTSSISSNLPELLSIWTKIEEEMKQNGKESLLEFHRISCRFERTPFTLSLKSKLLEDMKNDNNNDKKAEAKSDSLSNLEGNYSSNVKTYKFEHEDTPSQGLSHEAPGIDCIMAREYHAEIEQKQVLGKKRLILSLDRKNQTEAAEQKSPSQVKRCTTAAKLKSLNIALAVCLVFSVGYILYLSPAFNIFI